MTDLTTWEQRIAAWRASGQSARAYSEGKEFTVHMLRYWVQRLARTAAAGPSVTAQLTATRPGVRLAQVIRAEADPAKAGARDMATRSGTVVIAVGGAQVTVTPGFDRATLAAVLSVLECRGGS